MLAAGTLRKGAGGPEIGHLQGLLQRQASRHHLTEDALHRRRRQRPGVDIGQAAQHLGLALRAVDVALLDLAHTLRAPRTLGQSGQDFLVEVIDAIAQVQQFVTHAQFSLRTVGSA
ncbi:hypothetical protein SDC9_204561 [bioreactor metagenome]|uniref:Uncharacterized protein n=1 Tax=bioreactor metagenome TaxID=1076179 RepID=A0A645IZL5_9ZZZZ